ncbi:DNA ligase (ATP) [Gryganskiella cystojenkinii]|nr:DNA ligase (ATP) [Gryganskiella cystojenkinii]
MSSPDSSPKKNTSTTTATSASAPRSQPDDDPSVPSPPFFDLVMLLEEMSKKSNEKGKLLSEYFRSWRANGYGNMFPVIRLLLPGLDRERGRYGLKESKMADMYIQSLNIPRDSEPAYKLKHWKEGMRDSTGDFSMVAYDVIVSRSSVTVPQGHTIRDVNKLLTGLSKKDSTNLEAFRTLVQHYTARENKWIIRIINRDLKIKMSENSVLPCYHPDAADLFNVCSDLRKTVMDCADLHVRISTSSVTLMNPFKPMLSKKIHSAKEVVELMRMHPFWIENKLDGERVQVHKDGENYRYWSRNSTEFTRLYGATPNEGSLTPFLHPLITSKAESLILDGEMLEYDPATKEILKFGTVKTAGGDHSTDEHKRRPFLYVFDVLFMNGASLIEHPLEARQEMLPALIPREEEGRIQILQHQIGTTEQHIIDAIDTAVEDRQEGVIIKDPKSKYIPNGRGSEWIKIKPEYMDSKGQTLDVLIVGGYYGSGSRGGQGVVSSYLCAVRDDIGRAQDGKKFMTFCKFGTGFSFDQMGEFSPHWKEFKHYRNNPWVDLIDNAKMRPDVIIDPEKSIVVEIKAAEIVSNSTSYACDYTLRFPRFLHIREDKDANSCLTLSELFRLNKDYAGKLTGKAEESGRSSAASKKTKSGAPRKSAQPYLLPSIIGTDTSKVKLAEDIFKGQIFYVRRGDTVQDKKKLEIMIKEYGGVQSQSEKFDNTIVIAGTDGPDLKGLKDMGNRNIVLPSWIRDCVEERRLIPLNPKYMLFATRETEKQFRLIMDEFNDSYLEPLTMEAFEEILKNMPNRSQVVEQRRLKMAAEKAAKIKVKRINNLLDQIEPTALSQSSTSSTLSQPDIREGSNDQQETIGSGAAAITKRTNVEDGVLDHDTKQAILQMELEHPNELLEEQEATRARSIAASLTRKYYGTDGELQGPLGLFQGMKVFIVYPPKPEDYLESLLMTRKMKIKEEERENSVIGRPRKATKRNRDHHHAAAGSGDQTEPLDHPPIENMFDVMSKALDDWRIQRDASIERVLEDMDTDDVTRSPSSSRERYRAYEETEIDRRNDRDHTLKKLSNYSICRNNLDMVSIILKHHGAQVISEEKSTIEHCQRLFRDRLRKSHQEKMAHSESDHENDDDDFGMPTRICILFDPMYLDPVEEWSKAIQVKSIYGYSEIRAADEAASFTGTGSLALPRPRLVTSTWVIQSHNKQYTLPEEGFYPSLSSSSSSSLYDLLSQ